MRQSRSSQHQILSLAPRVLGGGVRTVGGMCNWRLPIRLPSSTRNELSHGTEGTPIRTPCRASTQVGHPCLEGLRRLPEGYIGRARLVSAEAGLTRPVLHPKPSWHDPMAGIDTLAPLGTGPAIGVGSRSIGHPKLAFGLGRSWDEVRSGRPVDTSNDHCRHPRRLRA